MHVYIYIYTHTYIHIYKNTHIHTHTHTQSRIKRAISANAGFYTLPSRENQFPYGFGGISESHYTTADLISFLKSPLTVLLGTTDNDPK